MKAFASYGNSIFSTLSLLFDSPLLLTLRPVSALYNIVFIVAWWFVLLPMLVVLVIYAVRKTMTQGGEAGAAVLGKEGRHPHVGGMLRSLCPHWAQGEKARTSARSLSLCMCTHSASEEEHVRRSETWVDLCRHPVYACRCRMSA